MIIGYTTGVFDMFHVGHLNILRRAKEQCDYLIVGVSTDELVENEEHKTPVIPFSDRCRILEAIKYVDQVVPQFESIAEAWQKLHFQKMYVGFDWQGTNRWKICENQLSSLGVELVYLNSLDGITPSVINNKVIPQISRNEIIGYTQGVYDMFHIGHLNLLLNAKSKCDRLIVGVNSDKLVQQYKNKTPLKSDKERSEIVKALKCVDDVIICNTLNKSKIWESIHFNLIFIGNDWKGNDRWKKTEDDLATFGASVIYLQHTDGISSTSLRLVEKNKVEDFQFC